MSSDAHRLYYYGAACGLSVSQQADGGNDAACASLRGEAQNAPRIKYARNARSAYNPRTMGRGCRLERFAQWWPVPIPLGLSCGRAFLPITLNIAFENKKSQSKYALRFGALLVEMMGIEPTTSTLRTLRSPN